MYSPIFDFTAERVISEINEHMDEPVKLRLNTPGGSVFAAWGIIQKIKEHGDVQVVVDGAALSMGYAITLFSKNPECNDMTKFMVHKAAMYTENDDEKRLLAQINSEIRKKFERKIDAETFEGVTKKSYDDVFSDDDTRDDVWIDAKQAKKIGLVAKVNKLDPEAQSDIYNIAASYFAPPKAAKKPKKDTITNHNKNKTVMDVSTLKAEHKDVFSKVTATAVENEQERVKAWLAHIEADQKKVIEGIKSGKEITQSEREELLIKAHRVGALKDLEDEGKETEDKTETPKGGKDFDTDKTKAELQGMIEAKYKK